MLPAAAVMVSFTASSQVSPPAFASIALANDPLYATTSGDKPALALALSVEYPTVGAQYTPSGDTDNTYANTTEYIGYYDAESCYKYNDAPTETPDTALSQTTSDLKRFYRSGAATNRMCADAFSGNFLNWASNSAIDMLRLALSGGDRYIDRPTLTVLQRAVIPNGDPVCMWNSTNFPAKQLRRTGGTSGRAFFGAVPLVMATAADTNDIWVGNTLDRIYFGTARGGSCGDPTSYKLGASGSRFFSGPRPAETVQCATENQNCNFSDKREVWYGANNSWQVATFIGGTACTNAVFTDPLGGTAKACYTRSPPTSGSGTALNSDGFFYARVQVCDLDSAGALNDNRDYPFCTRYPNGNFKPGGAVQKYSDQLRLAAFGYLLDQTASANNGRYGGVLRAPMKYVGNKTFDVYGQDNTPATGNSKSEWDPNTGVYKINPDTDAMGISGVINYLNKFGRTGPTKGRYKIYDPVSELYYETLRYMQGLQPSTDAVSNISTEMKDGFPVFTDWRSPTLLDPYAGRPNTGNYACLKSNIVVIGDINTHDGNRYPRTDVGANIPDLNYWTTVVGDFERNNVRTYADGQNVTRQTGNPNTVNGGPRSEAIIGYSYWAHTHDIRGTDWTDTARRRPGLRVKTFLFDVNEYGAQNDATTRRNRNQFFTSAKYGGFESNDSGPKGKSFNTYGNPFRRQDGTVDNNIWQKTADPGEAGTYYLQSSARSVLTAFDDIFSSATTNARSIAGSAITGQRLSQNDKVFQGSFDTQNWTGDLQAFAITTDTTQTVTIATAPTWSASDRLALLSSPEDSRNIVVGNSGATSTVTATAFTWTAASAELKAMLNKATPTATASDGLGEKRLNFIRGSNEGEGTQFRNRRNKLLGDIVNSGAAYSGAPLATITSSTYATFRTDNLARTPTVFIGANDGMLHAFEASTGNELFGYIPSWLRSKLSLLSSPDYVGNHQSYVDATPAVGEAQVGSANTAADWKTVLVGGTGAGGRGVYALDITNPAAFDASKVMWEFTQKDDADMGFVVGKPKIVKMRTSASTATTPVYKWFAVVGSGVNNYTNDGANVFSTTGKPALFLLDLSKPVSTAWTLNSNYYKISFPVNSTLSATVAPGLINFEATSGPQREVKFIFAGDLHGNMWKLDFSTVGVADWNLLTLSPFVRGGVPYPLFIAKDAAGNVQPISMTPTLVAGTRSMSIYVAFGTGKYLETADRTSSASNAFYVVNDNGTATFDDSNGASVISGRARLKRGSVDASTGAVTVDPFVWGRATSDGDTTQRSGWYYDYPVAGERQVTNAQIFGNLLIFGSLVPGATGGANACGVSGGSGNGYMLNVDDGNGTYRVSRVGILGQPIVVDLAPNDEVSNSTGRRMRTTPGQIIDVGSGGPELGPKKSKTIPAGRLSWRQINNYNDLKNATP